MTEKSTQLNHTQNLGANKLKIGFTLGDLGGIGPEIFAKFLNEYSGNSDFEIKLIDENVLGERLFDYSHQLISHEIFKRVKIGEPSAISGEHSYKTLKAASRMAKDGEIDLLITGPVSKESLAMAGHRYSGQTEALADLNGLTGEEIEMLFFLGDFRVVLGTRHIPLKEVSENITKRLGKVVENSYKAMSNIFQIDDPKIAVSGINPHAGENGLLGTEEVDFILPLIDTHNQINTRKLEGPFPADYIFAKSAHHYLKGEKQPYDLYVASYHDQVLPMVKGIGGFNAINLTAGLPFVRISVDHGTAFDIAGKNLADHSALKSCVEFALAQLSHLRQGSATASSPSSK